MAKAEAQIRAGSKAGGKHYQFDEEHDHNVPAQMWFQESDEGLVLFIVFYTQACRWSRCLGCNLPSKSSRFHVSWKELIAQVDHVFAQPEVQEKQRKIRKLIVSNNGSVLDHETFSSTALMYLMVKVNLHFTNLKVICLETRPEYVEGEELKFLARALKEGYTPTALELAVGLEAYDERIRNEVFLKGLDLGKLERFVKKIAPYKYRLKCYYMQKPVPGMSDKEAVEDVRNGIDYLSSIATKHGVRINMHLNPTFVAKGTILEPSFRNGEYSPPRLVDVARAVLHAEGKGITVFIGLYDEGLAVEGGGFIRPGEESIVASLEQFNRTHDFRILERVCGERR